MQLLCISIISHQKAYNVRKSLLVLYKFDHVAKCNNLRVPTGRYAFPFSLATTLWGAIMETPDYVIPHIASSAFQPPLILVWITYFTEVYKMAIFLICFLSPSFLFPFLPSSLPLLSFPFFPLLITWVWVDSGCWWWTGRPGVLQFMGLQRVRHDWVTELITSTEMHLLKCQLSKSL